MKRYALAAAFTLLVAAFSWPSIGSAALRPRPSDLPPGTTHPDTVPDDFQVFNDYASPERRYSSARVVVHYVVLGIDAPPLNDDDADGVPDYVERVGEAADISLAYYEARGFRPIRADEGGPDARPDLYLSRFAPGSFGISLPATTAEGGAFAAVANNLDPSPTASFASVYGTVAHELFHLTQFSYVPAQADPDLPGWVLEGSAAGLETRVFPELDDIVDSLQQRDWFVAVDRPITVQTYGAQLLWRVLDRRYPGLLQAVLARMGAHPPAGVGRAVFAETFARVTGTPFTSAFLGYAVQTADEFSDRIRDPRPGRAGRLLLAGGAVRRPLPVGAGEAHDPRPVRPPARHGCARLPARERCRRQPQQLRPNRTLRLRERARADVPRTGPPRTERPPRDAAPDRRQRPAERPARVPDHPSLSRRRARSAATAYSLRSATPSASRSSRSASSSCPMSS